MNDFEDAITVCKELLKLDPSNSSAKKLMTAIAKDSKKKKEEERALYAKMVSALDGSSADVQAIIKEQDEAKKLKEIEIEASRKKNTLIFTLIAVFIIATAYIATSYITDQIKLL